MSPEIKNMAPKKMIGMRTTMSLSLNRTPELWKSFMMRRKEIKNTIGSDLYSMQQYEPDHFRNFNPEKQFTKWAVTEVSNFDHIPASMEQLNLIGGLYAVFRYKASMGPPKDFFGQIFGAWLPASDYQLDDRLHFEILSEQYRNNDPESEEEIWIPVKSK